MTNQYSQKGMPKIGERWENNHVPTPQSEFHRERIAARVRGEKPAHSCVVFGKCELTSGGILRGGDLALARSLDDALAAKEAAKTR